jgi:hypothetical protein
MTVDPAGVLAYLRDQGVVVHGAALYLHDPAMVVVYLEGASGQEAHQRARHLARAMPGVRRAEFSSLTETILNITVIEPVSPRLNSKGSPVAEVHPDSIRALLRENGITVYRAAREDDGRIVVYLQAGRDQEERARTLITELPGVADVVPGHDLRTAIVYITTAPPIGGELGETSHGSP